ncbi:hypothetical protein PsorP6_002283 [Peronosclerospora sorghi]|uniref:Uncharacterized protein n=1 Tax=Peronosclerospora sorghi TaxID=230839 RepID=A0ACC0WSB7_9STRA|nr:hypothetical protein PsorP6_002283 [Peronosclerospora sorghi]
MILFGGAADVGVYVRARSSSPNSAPRRPRLRGCAVSESTCKVEFSGIGSGVGSPRLREDPKDEWRFDEVELFVNEAISLLRSKAKAGWKVLGSLDGIKPSSAALRSRRWIKSGRRRMEVVPQAAATASLANPSGPVIVDILGGSNFECTSINFTNMEKRRNVISSVILMWKEDKVSKAVDDIEALQTRIFSKPSILRRTSLTKEYVVAFTSLENAFKVYNTTLL